MHTVESRHNTYGIAFGCVAVAAPRCSRDSSKFSGLSAALPYSLLALTARRSSLSRFYAQRVRPLTICWSGQTQQPHGQLLFLLKFNFPRISDKFVLEMYGGALGRSIVLGPDYRCCDAVCVCSLL